MANEFHYTVSLSIVHPTIDPQWITQAMPTLKARIQTLAGSQRLGKGGQPVVPPRKALLSHWLAELDEGRHYSGVTPLSDFILAWSKNLEKYRKTFRELRREGTVTFRVGWFSDGKNSAEVLTAEAMGKCADLGIQIELDFYSPDGTSIKS